MKTKILQVLFSVFITTLQRCNVNFTSPRIFKTNLNKGTPNFFLILRKSSSFEERVVILLDYPKGR